MVQCNGDEGDRRGRRVCKVAERSGFRPTNSARRIRVVTLASVAWLACLAPVSNADARPPAHVPPEVRITSPADGEVEADGRVDVAVEFAAPRGNVTRVELLVGGAVADAIDNPPRRKRGTHTFEDVDLSRLVGSAVTLRARAYQGNRRAGLAALSEPVTLVLDPAVAALRRLEADSEIEPIVHVVDGLARSTEVRVPFDPDLPDDAVTQALDFLGRYAELFGDIDPARLHLDGVSGGDEGVHLFFVPNRDGIGAFAGQLGVHLRDGHVIGTGGHFLPAVPDLPPATVSREQAEAIAPSAVPGTLPEVRGESRLKYFDPALFGADATGTRLAWRVTVDGVQRDGTPALWLVFVDAHSGESLFVLDTVADHQRPLEDFEIFVPTRSLFGCFADPDSFAVEQTHDEDGPISMDPPPAAAERMFDNLHTVYRHHTDNLGRSSIDGLGGVVKSTVNVSENNAWWDPDCGELAFGRGLEMLDVTAHEFQHAVDHNSATALYYSKQSGALDESYADVAGAVIEDEDWQIGEENAVTFSFCVGSGLPFGTLRDMAHPPNCAQPDHMGDFEDLPGTVDSGGVHINSGIPNKAAYLLAEGGTHRGVSVDGIGRARLALLYDAAQIERVAGNAGFMDARNATVAIARDWAARAENGFDSAAACATVNAFAAVGLGAPDSDCDGVSDAEADGDPDGDGVFEPDDNCPAVPNPDQDDADDDGTGDACTDDDDGDGVEDFFDNCPSVPNRNQLDEDGDSFGDACDVADIDGDGVDDADDNCVSVPNPSQDDNDGDAFGDACDLNDDSDAILDEDDNCPLVTNGRQLDDDGDGVGNACDNCDDTPNPEQANTDGDEEGDACDDDDDNDGVDDETDNCRLVANPDQLDFDNNGSGLACDAGEAAHLSGDLLAELRGTIRFPDQGGMLRLPVEPCLADGCPDWLASDVATAVGIESSLPIRVRLVDDSGQVVTHGTPTVQGQTPGTRLQFRPRADSFFRSPVDGGEFEGTDYFLEIVPAGQVGNGLEVEVEIDVESRGTGFGGQLQEPF